MKQVLPEEIQIRLTNIPTSFNNILLTGDDGSVMSKLEAAIRNKHLFKSELEYLHSKFPEFEKPLFDYLSLETRNIREQIKGKPLEKERIKCVNALEKIIEDLFNKPIAKDGVKLKINAPNNVVYDLLRQLKNISFDGKTNILAQSNEVLAQFLKLHIEGFENTSEQTIAKELAREQVIKKGKLIVSKEQNLFNT